MAATAAPSTAETSTASTDAPTPSAHATRNPDPTLYVTDGRFIQPGASASPTTIEETSSSSKTATTHRLALPAGYWEPRFVEQDALARKVTITLVAVEATPDAAAWNQLAGLTCSREVLLASEDDGVA